MKYWTRFIVWMLCGIIGCSTSDRLVLQSKGSDTMVMLMVRLSETYNQQRPNVVLSVNGGGSGTGIKSMIDGTTDFAAASRGIKPKEIELAHQHGIFPKEFTIAFDGLAIYVHRDNPIQKISFEELKCIYAEDGACQHWSDLGIQLDCGGDDTIVKLGRQNNSGTYEHFREEVLGKQGKFTNTLDQNGTQQVVDVIATARCAIGYGGMGFHGEHARYVCLAKNKGDNCSEPTNDNIIKGAYPFSRPLYLYTNGEPTGELKTFLDWAMGKEGQKIVLKSGFVPIIASE